MLRHTLHSQAESTCIDLTTPEFRSRNWNQGWRLCCEADIMFSVTNSITALLILRYCSAKQSSQLISGSLEYLLNPALTPTMLLDAAQFSLSMSHWTIRIPQEKTFSLCKLYEIPLNAKKSYSPAQIVIIFCIIIVLFWKVNFYLFTLGLSLEIHFIFSLVFMLN